MRPGTIVLVLASLGALAAARAAAPPPCTRTLSPGDDLQRAVDRARAGAVVCLAAGEFRLSHFLSITRDRIVLRGAGDATVLRLDDGAESPVVVIGDAEARTP